MGVLSIEFLSMITNVTTINIVKTPILNDLCFFFMSDKIYEIIIEKELKNPALVTSTVIGGFDLGTIADFNVVSSSDDPLEALIP